MAMMSLRTVHAGTGYQYLLRSVATNDAHDLIIETDSKTALARYYDAKGTPPGRWVGTGLKGFDSEKIHAGAVINADQMANLYGVGLHPEAEEIWKNGGSYADAKLGRAFQKATGKIPVLKALKQAEKQFIATEKRGPTMEERSDMAIRVGKKYYIEETGYTNPSGDDIVSWINKQQSKVRQAAAGFDWTFSPTKSVSVLWALADEKTAHKIAECHHKAVQEALSWAEENAIYTRVGTNGIQQVKTQGLIAAEFTHFDTRTGDPDLHSHVLVSNKVQAPDGRWLTLDSQEIFRNAQSISARYDTALMEILSREMGLTFKPSQREGESTPVWEIAGVPKDLISLFSSRREQARPVFDQLVADYSKQHDKQPDKITKKKLWEKAILQTRDAKKPAQSLGQLRENWAIRVQGLDHGDELLQQIQEVVSTPADDQRQVFGGEEKWQESVEQVAETALANVTSKRGVFGDHHVRTAVFTELKGWKFQNAAELAKAETQIVDYILEQKVVSLSPGEVLDLPSRLLGDNALGVDRRVGRNRYTTQEILNAEQLVLDSCTEPTPYTAPNRDIDEALAGHEKAHGWTLNEGQEAMARSLLTTGALVSCGVGPAGTGKTTSMQIVSKVWKNQGRNVIGLAPSAQAASVLGEEIGCETTTIDKLTFTWRGQHPKLPGHDLDALEIKIQPGDMLLVDEAGMASTQNLAALVEIAKESGAVVRMIGDPHQLSAVGSGGLFNSACQITDAVELTEVMRFSGGKDTEQADASLKIRKGDKTGLDVYEKREWVSGGTRQDMVDSAVADYLDDIARGRKSLIVASTNADVDRMNQQVRAHRISIGEVDDKHHMRVGRGDVIGVGDIVITRQNKQFYRKVQGKNTVIGKVMNGQLFTVVGLKNDGDVEVKDLKTGKRQVIPADYAAENMHLGYAATVHRAQGATVDVCRAVVDQAVDRAGLYVALSRGKKENRAYCVTEADFDFDAEDMHYHMGGHNDEELTPRKVLEQALAKDNRSRSATEIAQQELADSMSRDRVQALYVHGCDLARSALAEHVRTSLVDALPQGVSLDADATWRIDTALKRLVENGVDVQNLTLEKLKPDFSADDVGAEIASCISRQYNQEAVISAVRDNIVRGLPDDAAQKLASEDRGVEHIDAALARMADAGVDADMIIPLLCEQDWDAAGSVGEAIAARIDDYAADAASTIPSPPPAWVGEDTELATWLRETYEVLRTPTANSDTVVPEITAGEVIENADFHGMSFDKRALEDVTFVHCDLRGVDFSSTTLRYVTFKDCQMDGADFSQSALSTVTFDDSTLPEADFTEATMSADSRTAVVKFSDCILEKARFVGAAIINVVFETCRMVQADFRHIMGEFGFFYDSDLTGSQWSQTPGGGISDVTAENCVGEVDNPIVQESAAQEEWSQQHKAAQERAAGNTADWWQEDSHEDEDNFLL